VNLKSDRPTVQQALDRLTREIALAREENRTAIKLIHGYGSTGVGGDIRIAVQKRLRELVLARELVDAFSERIGARLTMKPGASFRRGRN
jgi:hypothetical protein